MVEKYTKWNIKNKFIFLDTIKILQNLRIVFEIMRQY